MSRRALAFDARVSGISYPGFVGFSPTIPCIMDATFFFLFFTHPHIAHYTPFLCEMYSFGLMQERSAFLIQVLLASHQ